MAWQDSFDIGDEIIIEGTFRSTLTGAPRDPDAASLTLRRPGVAPVIIVGTDIVKVVDDEAWPQGKFRYITVANVPGVWRYKWSGTGAAAGSSQVYEFKVRGDTV